MIDLSKIQLGKCYRIGGRTPLVLIKYQYGTGKRVTISGYTRTKMKEYEKFNILYEPLTKDFKTIAEVEGTERPELTTIRVNSNTKVEEVQWSSTVPNPSYTTDEIDNKLKQVQGKK